MNISAFLRSLNTHAIAGVGLGTAALSIAATALQHPVDHALSAHPSVVTGIVQGIVDSYVQSQASNVGAVAGALAAYFGRPKTIPSN